MFVNAFAGQLINIHPARLLGRGASEPAWRTASSCTATGAFSLPGLDDRGPIIAQAAVQVDDEDTPDTLAAKVLHPGASDPALRSSCSARGRLAVEGFAGAYPPGAWRITLSSRAWRRRV